MTYTTVYAKPVAVCQLQSKCLWLSCLQLGIANRFSNWRYVKQVLLRQQCALITIRQALVDFSSEAPGMVRSDQTCFAPSRSRSSAGADCTRSEVDQMGNHRGPTAGPRGRAHNVTNAQQAIMDFLKSWQGFRKENDDLSTRFN